MTNQCLTPLLFPSRSYNEWLGDNLELAMEFVPGGSFLMGSPEDEPGRDEKETQHEVSIEPFFMGKYPITQAEWRFVAGSPKVDIDLPLNPSYSPGPRRPVDSVKWEECVEFCKRISNFTGRNYSLPSEAQWEYACRAGTTTPFNFGNTITTDLANFGMEREGITFGKTTEVGRFSSNAFGLCDMHGNVWEWCQDSWHDSYEGAPQDGSAWVTSSESEEKVIRGGAWNAFPSSCRSANRRYSYAKNDYSSKSIGFRIVCKAPDNITCKAPDNKSETALEYDVFIKGMFALYDWFQRAPHRDAETYYRLVSCLTQDEFMAACKLVFHEEKEFPTPATLVAKIKGSQSEPEIVWAKIAYALRDHRYKLHLDHKASFALKSIGGEACLRVALIADRYCLKKEFCEHWAAARHIPFLPELISINAEPEPPEGAAIRLTNSTHGPG